jgi:hypothetical protein
MRYMRTLQFVFDKPRWLVNLLLVTVCNIIPVVGPIVVMGYLLEVVEVMHRKGDAHYPDFEFGRFVPYLSRGVWPFLAILVAIIPLLVVLWMVIVVLAVVTGVAGQQGGGAQGAAAGVFFLLAMFLYLGTILLMTLVLTPMILRAGLTQEFAPAFSFPFITDFVGKVWKEQILLLLFITVMSIPLGMLGMLLCCVGIWLTATLLMFAQHHGYYQLYELYLARGGEPIPLKDGSKPPMLDEIDQV